MFTSAAPGKEKKYSQPRRAQDWKLVMGKAALSALGVSPCERIQPDSVEMGFRVRSARGRNNEMSAKEESVEIDFNVGRPCLAGSTKPATLR